MHAKLLADLDALEPAMRARRRDLHEHPELGFQETRTSGIVAEELRSLGLRVRTGVGKTGVVGVLEGAHPGPTLLLRFDMDALPIQEATGAPYASRNAGVMHACGHDGHVAIGLALARAFAARRGELHGTLKFAFQPAEELMNGASRMVEDGVLREPAPDLGLGLHLWNYQPVGWVGAAPGPVMAAADRFSAAIRGPGGHGATPALTRDPIVAAAHAITALQTITSRNVDALDSAVVTVGAIHGGEAFNVIPQEVRLLGTVRTFRPDTRERVLARVREVLEGTAQTLGCEAVVEIEHGCPAVVNDPALAARVRAIAAHVQGVREVGAEERTMGSEDMSLLMEPRGCFVFVGSNPGQLPRSHHHPRFDLDERALLIGAKVLALAAAEHVLPA
jgi:amidohydrolase